MAGEPESLDTDEDLDRRRRRHWYDRLIMLSDGVFSIAITLLAVDLQVTSRWTRLPEVWPSIASALDAYALSFLVISVYWLAHRRFFAMIYAVDAPLSVLTLFMLALVALLPAATRFFHSAESTVPAMMVYGILVVAIGVAMAMIWGYASLVAGLVLEEVPTRVRIFLLALILFTPPLFLSLTALLRAPPPGAVPLTLGVLFIIGWRMRRLVLTRILKAGPDGPAAARSVASA